MPSSDLGLFSTPSDDPNRKWRRLSIKYKPDSVIDTVATTPLGLAFLSPFERSENPGELSRYFTVFGQRAAWGEDERQPRLSSFSLKPNELATRDGRSFDYCHAEISSQPDFLRGGLSERPVVCVLFPATDCTLNDDPGAPHTLASPQIYLSPSDPEKLKFVVADMDDELIVQPGVSRCTGEHWGHAFSIQPNHDQLEVPQVIQGMTDFLVSDSAEGTRQFDLFVNATDMTWTAIKDEVKRAARQPGTRIVLSPADMKEEEVVDVKMEDDGQSCSSTPVSEGQPEIKAEESEEFGAGQIPLSEIRRNLMECTKNMVTVSVWFTFENHLGDSGTHPLGGHDTSLSFLKCGQEIGALEIFYRSFEKRRSVLKLKLSDVCPEVHHGGEQVKYIALNRFEDTAILMLYHDTKAGVDRVSYDQAPTCLLSPWPDMMRISDRVYMLNRRFGRFYGITQESEGPEISLEGEESLLDEYRVPAGEDQGLHQFCTDYVDTDPIDVVRVTVWSDAKEGARSGRVDITAKMCEDTETEIREELITRSQRTSIMDACGVNEEFRVYTVPPPSLERFHRENQ